MAYTSFYKGIAFVEGNIPNAKVVRQNVSAKLGGFGSHLKTLTDVKDILVDYCAHERANAVINFRYGQNKALAIDDMIFRQWGFGYPGSANTGGTAQEI